MPSQQKSKSLYARAVKVLPGGVSSPVRAFQAVGGTPVFVSRARGATLVDVDGNRYVDYVMSWGPLLHGHAPAGQAKAIVAAVKRGTSYGADFVGKNAALSRKIARNSSRFSGITKA